MQKMESKDGTGNEETRSGKKSRIKSLEETLLRLLFSLKPKETAKMRLLAT